MNEQNLKPADPVLLAPPHAKDQPGVLKVVKIVPPNTAILVPWDGGAACPYPLSACQPYTSPFERLAAFEQTAPIDCWLRIQARRLASAAQLGRTTNIKILPLPHQVLAAQQFLANFGRTELPKRLLIADEPGLGKTTEACLIYTLLRRQGLVKRPLFLVPPRVLPHWLKHLALRFGHPLTIVQSGRDIKRVCEWEKGIASIDLAKLKQYPEELTRVPWDFIVFDEAHHITPTAELRYKLVHSLLARNNGDPEPVTLFLTATPHSGDSVNFLALLHLLNPALFSGGDPAGEGRENLAVRALSQKKAENLIRERASQLSKQIVHQTRRDAVNHRGERLFPRPDVRYVFIDSKLCEVLQEEIRSYCQVFKKPGFLETTYQRIAGSSFAALEAALRKRLSKNRPRVEGTNRSRPSVAAAGPDYAGTQRFHDGEAVEDGLRGQKPLASAEVAALETLLRRVPGPAGDEKLQALLSIIDERSSGPDTKFLIFVEFRATQSYLEAQLEKRYGKECCARIRGGMTVVESYKQMGRFKGECRFLISTDAGSEGIDLQVCSHIVNYDLPWNPMRLEQRIGRVFRFGMGGELHVVNLVMSRQDRVYQTLNAKIDKLAELDQLETRGSEGSGQDLRIQLLGVASQLDELADLYTRPRGKSEGADEERRIDEILERSLEAWGELQEILGFLPAPDSGRLQEIAQSARLDEVREFVSRLLGQFKGHRLEAKPHAGSSDLEILSFKVPPEIEVDRKAALGRDRRCTGYTVDYEAALTDEKLKILASGDPVVDGMIAYCSGVGGIDGDRGRMVVNLEGVGRFRGVAVFYLVSWSRGRAHKITHLLPVVLDERLVPCPELAQKLEAPFQIAAGSRADFGFARELVQNPERLKSAASKAIAAHSTIARLKNDGAAPRWREEAVIFLVNVPPRGGGV